MEWVSGKIRVNGKVYDAKMPKPKGKMQFSQKICVFSCVFVVLIWLGNFALLLLGREQMSDAVSIGFTVFGGFVTGGYFTLSGARDCSKNRHGINQ